MNLHELLDKIEEKIEKKLLHKEVFSAVIEQGSKKSIQRSQMWGQLLRSVMS